MLTCKVYYVLRCTGSMRCAVRSAVSGAVAVAREVELHWRVIAAMYSHKADAHSKFESTRSTLSYKLCALCFGVSPLQCAVETYSSSASVVHVILDHNTNAAT
jgi:hypothetical protein